MIVDLVPNHTSSEHPWFPEALASPPVSPTASATSSATGTGRAASEPPNNWQSRLRRPGLDARRPDGRQWYLHLFAAEQPDLNWRNPEVRDDFERTLRFWLDRGVDGFRIDVAHRLYKDAELRDNPGRSRRPRLLRPRRR